MKNFIKKYYKLLIIVLFIFIILFFAFLNYFGVLFFAKDLSNGYFIYNNKIYYYDYNNIKHRRIIKDADVKTFEVKEDYATDKNYVYFNGKVLDFLDSKTFKKHKNNCSKGDYYSDKNNNYYVGYDNKIEKIKNINSDCIQIENRIFKYNSFLGE